MKTSLVVLAGVVAALTGVACSSSSGGGGGTGLASGSYTIANGQTVPDTCQVGDFSQQNGTAITVTVTGTSVDLPDFGITFTQTGTALAAPQATFDIDWTTTAGQIAAIGSALSRGYNCNEHDTTDYSGTVTGHNKFSATIDIQYTMTAGSSGACVAANNSAFGLTLTTFPCESKVTFDAAG